MKFLRELTYRHVTVIHHMEGTKYMNWYFKERHPEKTIGIVQIRGLTRPLTEAELRTHIDKLWEEYERSKTSHEGGV